MRTHLFIADLNPGWGARHDREEGRGVGGKMGNQQRRNNPHRRERTRIQDGRAWLWAAMVVGLWFGASRVSAQTTITLVEYTNVWKYSATGTDLGTGWRSNSFDDSAWRSCRRTTSTTARSFF